MRLATGCGAARRLVRGVRRRRTLRLAALAWAWLLLAASAPARGQDAAPDGAPDGAPAGALPLRGPVYLGGPEAADELFEPAFADRPLHVVLELVDRPSPRSPLRPEHEPPFAVRIALGSRNLAALEPPPAPDADPRALAAWIESLPPAEIVFEFVGGDVERWIRTLFPARRAIPLIKQLWLAHSAGAAVVARAGAAGAFAGATIIDPPHEARELLRGASGARERNPRKQDRREVAWGLSFFPWPLIEFEQEAPDDQAGLARFVEVMHAERMRFGLYLPRNGAVRGWSVHDRFEGLGAEPALVLDLRPARRSPGWLFDARLSELGLGDVWAGAERSVSGPGSRASGREQRSGELELALDGAAPLLERTTLDRALRALADSDLAAVGVVDGRRGLRVAFDERTTLVDGRLHQVRFSVWNPEGL